VIGAHPSVRNLWFANGFSGHGMQHAPAAARGIAELIARGRFETLDLAPLGFLRLLEQRPLRELNVIG
jgi:glycine/D-amino acid oxidase-like deaminating enzyme